MGNVTLIRNAQPDDIWPGVACVNRDGVALAYQMLVEFEDNELMSTVSASRTTRVSMTGRARGDRFAMLSPNT
jgi:hypothetical protein